MITAKYRCPHDGTCWEDTELYARKQLCHKCMRSVEPYEVNKIIPNTVSKRFEVQLEVPKNLEHMVNKVDAEKVHRAMYDMLNTILKEHDTVRINIKVNETTQIYEVPEKENQS